MSHQTNQRTVPFRKFQRAFRFMSFSHFQKSDVLLKNFKLIFSSRDLFNQELISSPWNVLSRCCIDQSVNYTYPFQLKNKINQCRKIPVNLGSFNEIFLALKFLWENNLQIWMPLTKWVSYFHKISSRSHKIAQIIQLCLVNNIHFSLI